MRGLVSGIGALGVAVVATAPAAGADMAAVPRVVAVVDSWTGFYAGLSISDRWTHANWNTLGFDTPGFGFAPFASDNLASLGSTAARWGGYAGLNIQRDIFVAGIEADVGSGNSSQSIIGIPGSGVGFAAFAGSDTSRTTVQTTWDASLRARAGFLAAPNILLYGTAGVAFQHVKETILCSGTVLPDGCFPISLVSTAEKTLTGWTAGFGIEAAFAGNWLVRGEYRYADFGNFDNRFDLGPTNPLGTAVTTTHFFTHTATLGLAYKFGLPVATDPVPVMPVKALVKAPVKAPPVAITPSWTGFYVGASAGARHTDAEWITQFVNPFPALANQGATLDSTAFRYGGYAGFDVQIQRLVVGLEASIGQGVNASRSAVGIPGLGGTLPPFGNADSVTARTGWDDSVVARMGVLAAPNVLVYATGGVAFQRVTVSAFCSNDFLLGECIVATNDESVSRTLRAGTIGAGIEAMVAPNVRARFDYRYANFGGFRHTFFPNEPLSSPTVDIGVRTQTATFGLAYQFGPTAVVASY
jgi:outer membrane immunogenic protein